VFVAKANTPDVKKEIKQIEKAEQRLAQQKKKLLEQEKKKAEESQKLDKLVQQSGYASPKALVDALCEKYGIRMAARKKSGKTGRRKRTKVTPELRDSIKKYVKGGGSMNQASKEFDVSYAVVAKIMKGAYDSKKGS